MGYIIRKHHQHLYLVEENEKYLWSDDVSEAADFLSELHAMDISELLDFEVDILSRCKNCNALAFDIGVSANGNLYCGNDCCYEHAKKINKRVWYA